MFSNRSPVRSTRLGRALTGLGAAALVAAGLIGLVPGTAFATYATLTATTTCVDAQGNWSITWKSQNSESNKTMTYEAVDLWTDVNYSGTPNNDGADPVFSPQPTPKSGFSTAVSSYPFGNSGTIARVKLQITVDWVQANSYTTSLIVNKPANCPPATTTTTAATTTTNPPTTTTTTAPTTTTTEAPATTTTTPPAVTTTVPEEATTTTTTVSEETTTTTLVESEGVTTTTLPGEATTTTVADPTTTTTATGPVATTTSGPTSQPLSSNAAVTTTVAPAAGDPSAAELPMTGGASGALTVLGVLMLAAGGLLISRTRFVPAIDES